MLHKWKNFHRKRGAKEASRLRRAGITLVETLVSVTLLMIMMTMVVGIVSPAFKVFIRMQKLQFAQMILDNVVEDVQDTVREATTYVKIYASDGGTVTNTGSSTGAEASIAGSTGINGNDSGLTLEYVNTDGYVVLVSTGGCDTTYLYRNNMIDGTFDAVNPGQLLFRYYRRVDTSSGSSESGDSDPSSGSGESGGNDTSSGDDVSADNNPSSGSGEYDMSNTIEESTTTKNQYYYKTTKDSKQYAIARAATTAFGSGYYMGNYLKIEFSFPDGVADGEKVTRLNATASLYDDSAMTDLVATEEFIIDLRYDVVREDGETAIIDTGSETMTWNVTSSGE